MDNLVALLFVLIFTAAIMVGAMLFFPVMLILYGIYWLMRLSAWIYQKLKNQNSPGLRS